jgi:hypothetical protein
MPSIRGNELTQHVPARESGSFTLLLLLGIAIYLYLNLFYLPATPFLLGGDQVFFWLPAMRMLEHARIYQDFYQFTPPGTDLVYFGLFRVFGSHVWITNAFVLILGVALSWMCFSIARSMMNRASALLATALFLVLTYSKLLNATHHWISVFCVMAAVKLRTKSTSGVSTVVTGGLLGLASFFTQTRGVAGLVAFICFLTWRQWRLREARIDLLRDVCLLVSGFVAAWLLLDAYFIATIGLRQIWHFQVTNARPVAEVGGRSLGLPEQLAWHTLPKLAPYLFVYLLLAIVYPVTLWRSWRKREESAPIWEGTTLLAIVGFFMMAEVAVSLNWLRLYAVSIPAFILLGLIFNGGRRIPRYAFALVGAVLCCLAGWQTVSRHLHQRVVMDLPAGTVATSPEVYEKIHWLAERTKPGDFLFQAAWPGVYLPLGLRDPSYLESVSPFDGPRSEDVRRVPSELETRRVWFVVWPPSLDSDARARPSDDSLPLLHRYLEDCYVRVKVFADEDEVWQRRDGSSCVNWTQTSPADREHGGSSGF